MSATAVDIANLKKSYGRVRALRGISLKVRTGEIFALLGPNGAGKTTLIRILTTLLEPDSGRAMVASHDVVKMAGRVREVIGLAGQYASIDEHLSGLENLEMVGRLYHLPKATARTRAIAILKRMGLSEAAKRPAKTYSGGMRRRLDLGASFIIKPVVLFLDEPTTGLDPHARIELWQTIRKLAKEGTSILLSTQYLDEAEELADRIAVIDQGKLIAEGTVNQLRAKVGGRVLEVSFNSLESLEAAQTLLIRHGIKSKQLLAEPATRSLSIHLTSRTQNVLKLLKDLGTAQLEVVDFHLRRPTLNEIFLKLTTKPSEANR